MQVTRLQRILSFLFPVKIWKGSGTHNEVLELFLSNGEWQLATADAIYSDGTRYRPLAKAFNLLGQRLAAVERVLLLGSGMGSGVQILRKMGFHPDFVLVDADQRILELASLSLGKDRTTYVCADAAQFVAQCTNRFDLIIVDVFIGRTVPSFVSDEGFIKKCRSMVHTGGTLVINYMLNSDEDKLRYQMLKSQLSDMTVIDIGINKVIVATV